MWGSRRLAAVAAYGWLVVLLAANSATGAAAGLIALAGLVAGLGAGGLAVGLASADRLRRWGRQARTVKILSVVSGIVAALAMWTVVGVLAGGADWSSECRAVVEQRWDGARADELTWGCAEVAESWVDDGVSEAEVRGMIPQIVSTLARGTAW
jgi:hypothetical protein